MLLRGLGPGRPPPPSDYLVYRDIQRKKLSHQTSEKILYLILSCIYFLRIPTKTTFISTKSWKSYQLIRGHVVFLFSFATYDVVRSWSIFVLPSIVLVNLFGVHFFKNKVLRFPGTFIFLGYSGTHTFVERKTTMKQFILYNIFVIVNSCIESLRISLLSEFCNCCVLCSYDFLNNKT